ncbi:MAG: DNA replication/repair protein RecF, partial [Candidatus Eremiobacteraeota bacterium]|nr:DNA replication/repair protein RecF [Candidatus Eremiobacteraeota bacterium]
MRLLSVHLSNIRNYSQLDFEPAPGLNVFVGDNAQGKSNLLEAISMLGTGKSFRTNKEGDLIRSGLEIANISGEAEIRAGVVRLGCTITQSARGTRKIYTVNGESVRYAKFLGSLKVVTFVPADLNLVAGPPGERRSFINVALAQETPLYYRELVRYQKALAQKNAMLRAPDAFDQDLLQVYNETLVEAGTKLMLARNHFVIQLHAVAQRVHAEWSDNVEVLEVRYEPKVAFEAPTEDSIAGSFAAALRDAEARERARQTSVIGPHRDDIGLVLDGKSLAGYGSQGQHRTAVLALKVAEYTVMHMASGEAPLLLLDDVLSELDPRRAEAFLGGVGAYEQAFITATHLPRELAGAARYRIAEGAV